MTRLLLSTAVLALIAAPSLAEAKKPVHTQRHAAAKVVKKTTTTATVKK